MWRRCYPKVAYVVADATEEPCGYVEDWPFERSVCCAALKVEETFSRKEGCHLELTRGDLEIHPLMDKDGPILHQWLNNPRVLAYYEGRDRPYDMGMVRERFLSKTDIGQVLGCLVMWKESPVGYVQVYPVLGEDLVLFGYPHDQVVYGMDQFLGESNLWNQGIGTLLVDAG